MKLSVVIIAKNAEELIVDAIDSVRQLADEVVVIDNASTDRTVEVAKYCKAEVFKHEADDFSKLRNYGLKKANGDWVLYIDTDERVSSKLKEEIMKAISSQNLRTQNLRGFYIKRKNFYLGNHEWPYVEKLERLFKKSSLKGWKGKLHESPIVDSDLIGVDGEIGELDGFLLHYTHRDLTSMLTKTIAWSKIEAELRFKADHPKMIWWRFFRVMATAFFDSYVRQGGWKAGTVGLIESIYQAFSLFITYARLWEMQEYKDKKV